MIYGVESTFSKSLVFLRKKGTYERVEQHNDLDTSQNPHLHNFYRFSQDLTGCKLVAMIGPANILSLFSSAG
jgi:hypothetical protein